MACCCGSWQDIVGTPPDFFGGLRVDLRECGPRGVDEKKFRGSAVYGDFVTAASAPGFPLEPLENAHFDAVPLPFHEASDPEPIVEVRRSKRRRRTVSAYREGDRTIVLIPARMTKAEEREWVNTMLERLEAQERRAKPSDEELLKRAHRLSVRYLEGAAHPRSVRWVSNQRTRWGSCTIDDASIRLSDRLQGMPEWVIDYVLLHELAHLLEPSHGPEFWELLAPYPDLEQAKGFLDGWSLALQRAGVTE